jgi:hypothetical protein
LVLDYSLQSLLIYSKFVQRDVLPLFWQELMIEGVKFKFIGFELNIIEERVETFEVHAVNVLLLVVPLCQYRLISKGNSPRSLT